MTITLSPKTEALLLLRAKRDGISVDSAADQLLNEILEADTQEGAIENRGNGKEPSEAPSKRKRIPGLHEGSVTMSDDFDAPLPDSFWLGEE